MSRATAETIHGMRSYFLHAGLLKPLEAVDLSSRSRLHIHRALERDGVPNFVRALESGPGNTASRQLGL